MNFTVPSTLPRRFKALYAASTPEQVAEAVCYLLGADAVTGQILFVDGGQHLQP